MPDGPGISAQSASWTGPAWWTVTAGSGLRLSAGSSSRGCTSCLIPGSRCTGPRPARAWPRWVGAASFDIADHVRAFPLAAPAGQAQLLTACEQLRRRRLDRSRPPWEAWFLPGLADGQVGVFLRIHHAMADGVAGVAAFGALFDPAAGAPALAARPWTPAPAPSARELLGDNARRRARGLGRALSGLMDPGGM